MLVSFGKVVYVEYSMDLIGGCEFVDVWIIFDDVFDSKFVFDFVNIVF